MNKIISIVVLSFLVALMTSCEDNLPNPDNTSKMLGIYLTDCPFEASEVNVEILKVIVEDKDGFQIELNTSIGIYNLLDFTEGVDTLLAEGNVELDDIESIYLELGNTNTIVVESVEYPLELKGDNLVKVNINLDQFDESADFIVDFFACTSIIVQDGKYLLKPVIKFKGKKDNNQGGAPDFVEDFIEDIAGCYTLVYPYSLVTKGNEQITVNDDEELTDALINNDIKSLAYPVTLQDVDGVNTTVDNRGQLQQLIKDCEDNNNNGGDDGEDNLEDLIELLPCYSVVYPIQVYNESDTIEIADSLSLVGVIDGEEYEALILPITVIDKDGQSIDVLDNEDLDQLADSCEDDEEDDDFEDLVEDIEECFSMVFPFELITIDDTTIEVSNQDDFELLVEEGNIKAFVYPFQLINEDDEIVDVNNKGQLKQIVKECE